MRRHRRPHLVVERRCCAGALRLHHCVFAVVSCVRKLHWLHIFLTQEYEAITTLSPIPGQAALRSESGCSHPEGTAWEAPRRGLLRHPRHHQAAGRRRSLPQVWCVGTRSRRFSYLVFLFLWVARHMAFRDRISSVETECISRSTARQEDLAVTRRHDTAERAHPAGLRRPVPLSAVTIRGLVLEWLDAEGLDVRLGKWWVRRLLHGIRFSCKKPAKRVKELRSPEQLLAITHSLSIKLC